MKYPFYSYHKIKRRLRPLELNLTFDAHVKRLTNCFAYAILFVVNLLKFRLRRRVFFGIGHFGARAAACDVYVLVTLVHDSINVYEFWYIISLWSLPQYPTFYEELVMQIRFFC